MIWRTASLSTRSQPFMEAAISCLDTPGSQSEDLKCGHHPLGQVSATRLALTIDAALVFFLDFLIQSLYLVFSALEHSQWLNMKSKTSQTSSLLFHKRCVERHELSWAVVNHPRFLSISPSLLILQIKQGKSWGSRALLRPAPASSRMLLSAGSASSWFICLFSN